MVWIKIKDSPIKTAGTDKDWVIKNTEIESSGKFFV